MRRKPLRLAVVFVALLAATQSEAQTPVGGAFGSDRPWEIVDNSFLIEEAFNQEEGIFQNIFSWTLRRHGEWNATFTQEWPVPGKKHQFSYTIPLSSNEVAVGIDDVFINYRYQLIDETAKRPALAPRLSMIVPTGNADTGLGTGAVGLQVNLAASKQFGNLYVHANVGSTWFPRIDSRTSGRHVSLFSPLVGGSVIWRVRPMLNAMFESLAEFDQLIDETGATIREPTVTMSPGLRYGWNIGRHQIVGGAAVPVSRSAGLTNVALLAYFSYELPFRE